MSLWTVLTWPQILWDLAVGDRAPGTTWGRQQREPVADKLTPAFKGTFCFLIYTVSKQYYIGIADVATVLHRQVLSAGPNL